MVVDVVGVRLFSFLTALAAALVAGLALLTGSAGAFAPRSDPCLLISNSGLEIQHVLGLSQVRETPTVGPHGKSSPDVVSSCKVLAWNGSKPTGKDLARRIRAGTAATALLRTWVTNTRSPHASRWMHNGFERALDGAVAGCAALGKDPKGGKVSLPRDGAQSVAGYQGVKVGAGLAVCGVWDRAGGHGRGADGVQGLGTDRIVSLELEQSLQRPVVGETTGISKYAIARFWNTFPLFPRYVFWATTPGAIGSIWRSNLDGSDPQTIVTGQSRPGGVAVSGDHLYWAAVGTGAIWEASLDGTGRKQIASGLDGVAANSTNLYWTNGDGTITEAKLDGSGAHTIISGQQDAWYMAVGSSHIYWTRLQQVWEANLDGSNPQPIVNNLRDPIGIAVDSSHLYWVDDAADTVNEANLDGSDPHTIVTGQIRPYGIAVDGTNLYWSDYATSPTAPGTIWESNLDGTSAQAINLDQQNPTGVAIGP